MTPEWLGWSHGVGEGIDIAGGIGTAAPTQTRTPKRAPPLGWGWGGRGKIWEIRRMLTFLSKKCPAECVTIRLYSHRCGVKFILRGNPKPRNQLTTDSGRTNLLLPNSKTHRKHTIHCEQEATETNQLRSLDYERLV